MYIISNAAPRYFDLKKYNKFRYLRAVFYFDQILCSEYKIFLKTIYL